jgi:hypothetical protein
MEYKQIIFETSDKIVDPGSYHGDFFETGAQMHNSYSSIGVETRSMTYQ